MPTRHATAEEITAAEKLVDELSTKAREAAPSADDLPVFLLDEEWQAHANAAMDAFEAAALTHEKLLRPDEPERWMSISENSAAMTDSPRSRAAMSLTEYSRFRVTAGRQPQEPSATCKYPTNAKPNSPNDSPATGKPSNPPYQRKEKANDHPTRSRGSGI